MSNITTAETYQTGPLPTSVPKRVLELRVEHGLRFTATMSLNGYTVEDDFAGFRVESQDVSVFKKKPRAFTTYTLYCIKEDSLFLYVQEETWTDGSTRVTFRAYSNENAEVAKDYLEQIEVTEIENSPTHIEMKMTYFDSHGQVDWSNKQIKPHDWEDIKDNYPENVQKGIKHFKESTGENGKLYIWYGAPGTGKTSAILSLWDPAEECNIYNIIDTDVLFNNASYIIQLISMTSSDKPTYIICEDAGNVITAGYNSAGLSKLLNLVDGIIGLGTDIKVLITTNEEIDKFNEAVRRPGRCSQFLEFTELDKKEANRWCKKHDRKPVNEPMKLAWLYNHDVVEEEDVTHGVYL